MRQSGITTAIEGTCKSWPLKCSSSHATTYILSTQDHGVVGWGNGEEGQLTTESSADVPEPVPIPPLCIVGAPTFTMISPGPKHVIAVTLDGQLYGWGSNAANQLGYEAASKDDKPLLAPTLLERAHTVTKQQRFLWAAAAGGIDSHAAYSLVLGVSGRLWQLGDQGPTVWGEGVVVPVMGLSRQKVAAAACGSGHCVAVTDQGRVYEWSHHSPPSPVHALRGVEASMVAAGAAHSAVLTSDGRVFVWYQRADGSTSTPEDMSGGAGQSMVGVACGIRHTMVVTCTGAIYAFASGFPRLVVKEWKKKGERPIQIACMGDLCAVLTCHNRVRIFAIPEADSALTKVAKAFHRKVKSLSVRQVEGSGLPMRTSDGDNGEVLLEAPLLKLPTPAPLLVSAPRMAVLGTLKGTAVLSSVTSLMDAVTNMVDAAKPKAVKPSPALRKATSSQATIPSSPLPAAADEGSSPSPELGDAEPRGKDPLNLPLPAVTSLRRSSTRGPRTPRGIRAQVLFDLEPDASNARVLPLRAGDVVRVLWRTKEWLWVAYKTARPEPASNDSDASTRTGWVKGYAPCTYVKFDVGTTLDDVPPKPSSSSTTKGRRGRANSAAPTTTTAASRDDQCQ